MNKCAQPQIAAKPEQLIQTAKVVLTPSVSISAGQSVATQEQSSSIPVALLEAELTASLAKVLYISVDDVDPDKKFTELGLDSIIGVEWIKEINKQYGTSIRLQNL